MSQDTALTRPSEWTTLHRVGSIGAIAYIVSIILTTTMFIVSDYDTGLSGLGHLTYIAEHRNLVDGFAGARAGRQRPADSDIYGALSDTCAFGSIEYRDRRRSGD